MVEMGHVENLRQAFNKYLGDDGPAYARPDDLRRPFGKFGPVKDIYLSNDYYTREPRGFGFIQNFDPEDASDAKYHMDGKMLLGREIVVVLQRKTGISLPT
uniref:RRM domain-containing protein n=1 Tax=Zea mays TaxID=4577 RepID=A0A804UFG0_MAIZE